MRQEGGRVVCVAVIVYANELGLFVHFHVYGDLHLRDGMSHDRGHFGAAIYRNPHPPTALYMREALQERLKPCASAV